MRPALVAPQTRVEFNGTIDESNTPLCVATSDVHVPEIEQDPNTVRIIGEYRLKGSDRLILTAEIPQGDGSSERGAGERGISGGRSALEVKRPFKITTLLGDLAQVVQSQGILRLNDENGLIAFRCGINQPT